MILTHAALVDVHVHLREPGGTHKEDIKSGTAAAYAGGFAAVTAMANTQPPTDSPERVRHILSRAAHLPVAVYPVAAVTEGMRGERLTDFHALKEAGARALSDDGLPVCSEALMRDALRCAKEAGLPLLSHCEPETELCERDLFLARQSGCPIHICHVSLADTVALLRREKRLGTPFTAETAPHYMVPWATGRMNPPLAAERDVEAVLDALCDGVLTCIATDHAPHTEAEKASENPPNGVIGLETALSVSLMALTGAGRMAAERVLTLLCEEPSRILGVPVPKRRIIVDTEREWCCEPALFQSKSRNSPFAGRMLRGTAAFADDTETGG